MAGYSNLNYGWKFSMSIKSLVLFWLMLIQTDQLPINRENFGTCGSKKAFERLYNNSYSSSLCTGQVCGCLTTFGPDEINAEQKSFTFHIKHYPAFDVNHLRLSLHYRRRAKLQALCRRTGEAVACDFVTESLADVPADGVEVLSTCRLRYCHTFDMSSLLAGSSVPVKTLQIMAFAGFHKMPLIEISYEVNSVEATVASHPCPIIYPGLNYGGHAANLGHISETDTVG